MHVRISHINLGYAMKMINQKREKKYRINKNMHRS